MAEVQNRLRCAVVQLQSKDDVTANLRRITDLVRAAAEAGAQFVTLPENALWLRIDPAAAEPIHAPGGEVMSALAKLASDHGIHLLVGSMPEVSPNTGRPFKTSVLFDAKGNVLTRYRKIHLFDVDLAGGESYRESDHTTAGDRLICADTPWGGVGLSICYDLRFPVLYQALAHAGARVLCVPAAFTETTGVAHWHALLRARAIENLCYVVAPAQWGKHGGNRVSYGHSLIVSPWGEILADIQGGEAFHIVDLDLDLVARARASIPCLLNARLQVTGQVYKT